VIRTLGQLAAEIGAEPVDEPEREIVGLRTLAEAGPEHLSFLTHPKYLAAARATRAGALLVGRRLPELALPQLVVGDPQAALARLLEVFHPGARPAPGAHPTAVIGARCAVDPSASIGAYVVLGDGASVGADAVLHPHVVVGEDCVIGARSVLHAHVVLYPRVRLGADVVLHAGAVLGADGFGYASGAGAPTKIPQVGGVEIGDDVEIGALSAVDRALLGTTRVGAGSKIDNLVQVGHNVEIGRNVILCGQVGVAGSAKLGDGVVLGGQAGVAGHLTVGAGAQVASKSAVYASVPDGEVVAGIPARKIGEWRRAQALLRRLEEIVRRLRALERGSRDSDSGPVAERGESEK
jgi:UDP-3-O-[3-hydroxymyristoyl] glucosamine N-acyltransferase